MRGDVIDIFPADSDELAIRVELFDEEIENIARFDPLTGAVGKTAPHYHFSQDTLCAPRETRCWVPSDD